MRTAANGRIYERRFDWDEARRLRRQGLAYEEIARRLGVTGAAVARVCDPRIRDRMASTTAAWMASGTCEVCGARCSRNSARAYMRCAECANEEKRDLAREALLNERGWVLCTRCGEHKPMSHFSVDRDKRRSLGGLRQFCRACETAAKRDWRRRNQERAKAYDREYRAHRRAEKAGR